MPRDVCGERTPFHAPCVYSPGLTPDAPVYAIACTMRPYAAAARHAERQIVGDPGLYSRARHANIDPTRTVAAARTSFPGLSGTVCTGICGRDPLGTVEPVTRLQLSIAALERDVSGEAIRRLIVLVATKFRKSPDCAVSRLVPASIGASQRYERKAKTPAPDGAGVGGSTESGLEGPRVGLSSQR